MHPSPTLNFYNTFSSLDCFKRRCIHTEIRTDSFYTIRNIKFLQIETVVQHSPSFEAFNILWQYQFFESTTSECIIAKRIVLHCHSTQVKYVKIGTHVVTEIFQVSVVDVTCDSQFAYCYHIFTSGSSHGCCKGLAKCAHRLHINSNVVGRIST